MVFVAQAIRENEAGESIVPGLSGLQSKFKASQRNSLALSQNKERRKQIKGGREGERKERRTDGKKE